MREKDKRGRARIRRGEIFYYECERYATERGSSPQPKKKPPLASTTGL
jgi:hypothetical protein